MTQTLAAATLTKIEDILSEETMAISGLGGNVASTTCKHNCPSIRSIIATITELNPGMTTTLKHLKSHEVPSTTQIFRRFPIAPAMQAIVVDREPIVNPQLAPVVGDDAKPVMSCLEDSEAACPTHGEVVTSREALPCFTCVFIIHNLAPAFHVGFVIDQVLAPSSLTEVEDILPEETTAIENAMASVVSATGFHNSPSVGSIRPFVPEQHPSVTTAFKHLKSHKAPSSAKMLGGLAIAPTVQAVVIDCESAVNPELTPIIRIRG
jgi:hypothetical protein